MPTLPVLKLWASVHVFSRILPPPSISGGLAVSLQVRQRIEAFHDIREVPTKATLNRSASVATSRTSPLRSVVA